MFTSLLLPARPAVAPYQFAGQKPSRIAFTKSIPKLVNQCIHAFNF